MNHYQRTLLSYIIATFFAVVFQQIYAYFTPGVYAFSMQWMFLIPLLGGIFFFTFVTFFHRFNPTNRKYRLAYNLYNSGLATLTVASALNGVFEIALTDSIYLPFFWIIGLMMTVSGIGVFTWIWNQRDTLEA